MYFSERLARNTVPPLPVALDYGFDLPDCISEIPRDLRPLGRGRGFAELGERHFVSCMLPLPLGLSEEMRVAVWCELAEVTYQRVALQWEDPESYARLRFAGKLANALPPWGGRALRTPIRLEVRDPNLPPVVVEAARPWLQHALRHGLSEMEHLALIIGMQGDESELN